GIDLAEVAIRPETSVIDQDVDGQPLLFGKAKDFDGSLWPGKVRCEDFGFNPIAGFEVVSQLRQAVCTAGGQNEVGSVGGQLLGKSPPDAGTGSGYQSPFASPFFHRSSLLQMGMILADLKGGWSITSSRSSTSSSSRMGSDSGGAAALAISVDLTGAEPKQTLRPTSQDRQ